LATLSAPLSQNGVTYLGIRVESRFELQFLISHLRKELLHERWISVMCLPTRYDGEEGIKRDRVERGRQGHTD
jgi:hypothetical protein